MEIDLLKRIASGCAAEFGSKKRDCSFVVWGGERPERDFVASEVRRSIHNHLVSTQDSWVYYPGDEYVVNLDNEKPKY